MARAYCFTGYKGFVLHVEKVKGLEEGKVTGLQAGQVSV